MSVFSDIFDWSDWLDWLNPESPSQTETPSEPETPTNPETPASAEYTDVAGEFEELTGSTDNDIFVVSGNQSDYGWGLAEDGVGTVIWNNETGDADLLYSFETIRFADGEVSLADNPEGPVVEPELPEEPAVGPYAEYTDTVGEFQELIGAADEDVFILAGNQADYSWTASEDGAGTVIWNNETGDADLLYSFETLRFADSEVSLADVPEGPVVEPISGEYAEYTDTVGEFEELVGAADEDVFILAGNQADYSWTASEDGAGTVIWNNETGDADLLYSFETLRFADSEVSLADAPEGPVVGPISGEYAEYTDTVGEFEELVGAADEDVFILAGNQADYSWAASEDGSGTVIWNNETGNADLLYSFETLRFADAEASLAEMPSSETGDETVSGMVADIPGEAQFLYGSEGTDTFVIDGQSADYGWEATDDGGFVVWEEGTDNYDVLYSFEEIQFQDTTVGL